MADNSIFFSLTLLPLGKSTTASNEDLRDVQHEKSKDPEKYLFELSTHAFWCGGRDKRWEGRKMPEAP